MAFHTPGHKQGKGAANELHEMITDTGLKMEVSLMEELDDIHGASTCIKQAQDLASDLYGADETRLFYQWNNRCYSCDDFNSCKSWR